MYVHMNVWSTSPSLSHLPTYLLTYLLCTYNFRLLRRQVVPLIEWSCWWYSLCLHSLWWLPSLLSGMYSYTCIYVCIYVCINMKHCILPGLLAHYLFSVFRSRSQSLSPLGWIQVLTPSFKSRSLQEIPRNFLYVCICICIYVRMCVCVCARTHVSSSLHYFTVGH